MSLLSAPHGLSLTTHASKDSPAEDIMEMIAEMTALGLPTTFIARPEAHRKGRRKLSDSAIDQHQSATTAIELQENETSHSSIFCVRSVLLYTHIDPTLEVEILDTTEPSETYLTGDESVPVGFQSLPVAENSLNSECDLPQTRIETDVSPGEQCFSTHEEPNGEAIWEPVWDEQYRCYYFCNIQTCESTWDPPHGFEHYVCSSLRAVHESSLDVNCGEIHIREEKIENNEMEILGKCTQQVRPSGEMNEFGGYEKDEADEYFSMGPSLFSDLIEQQVSVEEMESLPAFSKPCGSHIRFSDSEDSSSDGGIDWEEITVETSMQLSKAGFEFCSPSSQKSPSSINAKIKQQLQTSKVGFKKKRLKSPSEIGDLDKVLLPGMVEMMSKSIVKYWLQRYSLFTKYDDGIKMDDEGWFSVTPEIIAKHQASRCATGLIIDAFTGVGGNAIQFALQSHHVIAIDIDPIRVEYARHNAEIYGVADKIEFIVGDFFQLAPSLKADFVFLSPPWGGPEYLKEETYDLHTMLQPKDGFTLFKVAQGVAPNIALFLPRNVDLNQLEELSWLSSPPLPCEVEENVVNDKLKAITAYYGEIADQDL